MQKRPLAVTVIGWIFIAVGTVGMLSDIWSWTIRDPHYLSELGTQGFIDLSLVWASRLLALSAGAFTLRGFNWARWQLVVWMSFHIVLSYFHSPWELLAHTLLFAPIVYYLFRQQSSMFFGAAGAASR